MAKFLQNSVTNMTLLNIFCIFWTFFVAFYFKKYDISRKMQHINFNVKISRFKGGLHNLLYEIASKSMKSINQIA